MPMRWTPENDQTLLLKILETSNITVDSKAIANLWPEKEGESKPTPRAITERLVKIRDQCRASGSGGFSVSSSQSKKPRTTGPTPAAVARLATPRKPRVKKEAANSNGAGFNSSCEIKPENGDRKPIATADGFYDLPDMIPTSSDTFSNTTDASSSQPATPVTNHPSGRKRHYDVFKQEHDLQNHGRLGGFDDDDVVLLPQSPSKHLKPNPTIAASFPGSYDGHYLDSGLSFTYGFSRHANFAEDDAF